MRTDPAPPSPGGLASVAELLGRFPVLHPPVSTAGAAVTIVLRGEPGEVEILLIERAANPDDPASGDVALPGGRVEPRDGSLASTALRELREEVGLGAADLAGPLRFVGATPARRFGLHVGVFAGELSRSAAPPTIGSPEEVAHIFWLPRAALEQSRLITRELDGGERRFVATVHDSHIVWGFTRRVLREFFGLAQEDATDGPVLFDKPNRPSGTGPTDPSG
jgi:8-oxo-dGTP pyrophosphatase MutT (NUDIX family)